MLHRTADDIFPKTRQFRAIQRSVTDEDRAWFCGELGKLDRWKDFHWLLSSDKNYLPALPAKTIEDITLSQEFIAVKDKVSFVCEKLAVGPDEVVAIEKATRGQSKNPNWSLFRNGCITASNFGAVLKPCLAKRRPSKSLLATLLGQYDLSGQHAIQWGLMHESFALSVYAESEGVEVAASGLWLAPSGLVGGSPDGIVNDQKIVEVKCPYSARSKPLAILASDKSFFICHDVQTSDQRYALNLSSDTGRKYFHQMQANMYFTHRRFCDLIVWTPLETAVITVPLDEGWIQNISVVEEFYKSQFLPVYFDGGV